MGAVLGISAFGRTQEKLAGTAANPTATEQISTQNVNMTGNQAGGYGSNQGGMGGGMNSGGFGGGMNSGGFGGTSSGGFGGTSSGGFGAAPAFGSTPSTPAPTFSTPGATSSTTGKPLGPAQSFPAL